jgi:16S rRNA (cytidine1402-2'-O)-methyltransferase
MMNKTSPKNTGTLFIIPNTLGKTPENNTIPEYVLNIIRKLDVFMVENVQSAARYLQWVGNTVPEYEIDFLLLNKETSRQEAATFLKPLVKGKDAGLLSEAGCPAVADPGAELINMAHGRGIEVRPLVGPSSILLALMGSGFNGQSFCFHGYLPRDENKRKRYIQQIEAESKKKNSTQIFMETPYRNDALVESILQLCRANTKFCAATNLTLPDESITSQPLSRWKERSIPSFNKKPTIFLLYADA